MAAAAHDADIVSEHHAASGVPLIDSTPTSPWRRGREHSTFPVFARPRS
jgi:hypothetical protein